jgi:Fe-S-cluster containining protein
MRHKKLGSRELRRKEERKKKGKEIMPEADYLTDEEKSALCLQCHKCCMQLPMSLKYEPDSQMFKEISEFFIAHGCTATVIAGTFVLSVPHVCQHLTEKGCAIYENRPQVCRNYDGRRDPRLHMDCLWVRKVGGMRTHSAMSDQAVVKLD